MERITYELEKLKLSALSKSATLNNQIHEITIGPKACKHEWLEKETPATESAVRNDILRTSVSPKVIKQLKSPFKLVMFNIEENIQKNVQGKMSRHILKFEEHDKSQREKFSQRWARQLQESLKKKDSQEKEILKVMEEHDLHADLENQKLLSFYQNQAEKRKEQDKVIKLKQEKNKKINACIDSIQMGQQEFRNIYLEIIQILKDLSEDCKIALGEHIKNLKVLTPQMDEVMNKCKSGIVEEQDMIKCLEIVNFAKIAKKKILETVENYEKQKLLILGEIERQQTEKIFAEQKVIEEKAKVTINTSKINKELANFVSKSALKSYAELQVFLQQHTENYRSLTEDNSLKSFKFDCKKVINLTVNAISSSSSDHLLDKYNKLYNLLSGKPVQLYNSYIIATVHPQGISFCMNLLARKFVLQGENVSSNPESAFGYATIIISLWNDFPELGKLLLAHFYQECPYLVPLYQPRLVDQSDEDYYKSLGYQYEDGQIERQDKFLKRMSGFFRLHFAILVSEAKRTQSQHPHDLSNGWTWFSRIINMEPKSDITATALLEFLEVAGNMMQMFYGLQFKKILYFLSTSYLQTLKNLDSGGSTIRLEILLEKYTGSGGSFDQPIGLLRQGFW